MLPPRNIAVLSCISLLLMFSSSCLRIAEKERPRMQAGNSSLAQEGKIPKSPYAIKSKPLDFVPPKPEKISLENGLSLYFLENHELPLVVVQAKTRVGSIYDPPDKVGLAGLTGEVMRTGGTESWSGAELDARLEATAAELANSIGAEASEAVLDIRKQDLEMGMRMFAEMLRFPRFEEEKVEIGKKSRLESIRRRNDNPSAIAQREFQRLLYGKDSVWARIPQPQTIRAITRQDLVAFHAKYYHPANTSIGISGDLTKEEAIALASASFGDWQNIPVQFPEIKPIDPHVATGAYFVDRNIPQSIILMGHFGYRRHDPAQLALTLLNEIFGAGGFTSRLMRAIRTDQGLAYSTYGYISKGTDLGVFLMSAETQVASTAKAAELMRQEMRKMVSGPVEQEELQLATDAEVNRFVFPFDSPAQVVSLQMDLDFHGYPQDWLANYVPNLRKIGIHEVEDAAQKFLDPEKMLMVVVGNMQQIRGDIERLGFGEPREIQLDPVE